MSVTPLLKAGHCCVGRGNFQLFGFFGINLLGRISSLIILQLFDRHSSVSLVWILVFQEEIAFLQEICYFLLFRIAQGNSSP